MEGMVWFVRFWTHVHVGSSHSHFWDLCVSGFHLVLPLSPPQWLLDCLACLLKLICQFAVDPADLDLAYHDVFSWSGLADSQRKRAWPGKSRKSTVEHGKGLHIPRLTEVNVPPARKANSWLLKQQRFASTVWDWLSICWFPGVPQPRTGYQPHPAFDQCGLHLRQPRTQVTNHNSTKQVLLVSKIYQV